MEKYKYNPDCISSDHDIEKIILNIQNDRYWKVNEFGSFILGRLKNPQNTKQIIEAIKLEYSVDDEKQITEDIERFLSKAIDNGIIIKAK